MPREALIEPFSLTKADSNVTSSDGVVASTAYCTIYSYQVPTGLGHIILPGHTIGMYLEGTDDAEMPATTLIKVSVQDAAQSDKKTILGPIMYASLKEFQDADKIAKFNVPEPVKVYEKQYIIIESAGADATGTGGCDQTGASSDCYFEAKISRVREPLT